MKLQEFLEQLEPDSNNVKGLMGIELLPNQVNLSEIEEFANRQIVVLRNTEGTVTIEHSDDIKWEKTIELYSVQLIDGKVKIRCSSKSIDKVFSFQQLQYIRVSDRIKEKYSEKYPVLKEDKYKHIWFSPEGEIIASISVNNEYFIHEYYEVVFTKEFLDIINK